jgi:hypothetical protein
MTLYKLTNENDQTHGGMQWGENVTHTASGKGELCGPGFIHAYTDPVLAVLLNPIGADFRNPHLWIAEGKIVKDDRGLKCGTVKLTTVRRMDLPTVTTVHRIAFAILCTKQVYANKQWNQWADKWLSGKNRAAAAAASAAKAAVTAATAAWAAAEAAAMAKAAVTAAMAATAATAAEAAAMAALQPRPAAAAAEAAMAATAATAAEAAASAADATKIPLDLIGIANQCLNLHLIGVT